MSAIASKRPVRQSEDTGDPFSCWSRMLSIPVSSSNALRSWSKADCIAENMIVNIVMSINRCFIGKFGKAKLASTFVAAVYVIAQDQPAEIA